jgi:hypothetical protein
MRRHRAGSTGEGLCIAAGFLLIESLLPFSAFPQQPSVEPIVSPHHEHVVPTNHLSWGFFPLHRFRVSNAFRASFPEALSRGSHLSALCTFGVRRLWRFAHSTPIDCGRRRFDPILGFG